VPSIVELDKFAKLKLAAIRKLMPQKAAPECGQVAATTHLPTYIWYIFLSLPISTYMFVCGRGSNCCSCCLHIVINFHFEWHVDSHFDTDSFAKN